VRIELIRVGGAEGRRLRAIQAEAMWEAMGWWDHQRRLPSGNS
jgi:hypothetical protein